MTQREINKSEKLLAQIGRIITSTIIDKRGRRASRSICTDGDGIGCPFGCPKIFASLREVQAEVQEYKNYHAMRKAEKDLLRRGAGAKVGG